MPVDLATFEQLLTGAGQSLLAEVTARADREPELALGTRLRKRYDADLVAAALTQHRLRQRAAIKFGAAAAGMYFTSEALEQATRANVSNLRAERLARADVSAVLDLGCGIGGDLLAFARAGLSARGVEQDPLRAAIARANLAALGLPGQVVTADLADVPRHIGETVFIDPARRAGRGRIFDVTAMSPPWEVVLAQLAQGAVVKTLPGIDHNRIPPGVEAQWVSDGGDLVEACLWGAGLASTSRRATVLPAAQEIVGEPRPGPVGAIGRWLHEPDDAVIRSGLLGPFAESIDGWLIDPQLAYLSSAGPANTPLARSFLVLEELPFRDKQLRAALIERNIGTLTVKKRGIDVVPEELVRRLRLSGSRPGTVVLARIGRGAKAFLVEPVPTGRIQPDRHTAVDERRAP